VLISRYLTWDHAQPIAADIAYCELVNDWNAEHWARSSPVSPPASLRAPGECRPAGRPAQCTDNQFAGVLDDEIDAIVRATLPCCSA
jgi:hypothetical protein